MTLPITRRSFVCAASVVALLGGAAFLAACGTSRSPIDVGTAGVYDWDSLLMNHRNRWFYYPEGKLSSKFGIDVSEHDAAIDWAAVKGDGVEFAFIRAGYRGYTEGGIVEDAYFEDNYEGAVKQGIPIGVYFFSSAIDEDEAVEEADYVLEKLDGRVLELPIVFDQEQVSDTRGRANALGHEQYTANARAFCERIEQAGYQAMIYGNQHYLDKIDVDVLASYPVWYAEYEVEEPSSDYRFVIWQYAVDGQVAGIETAVDMNIMFIGEDADRYGVGV